MTTLLDIALQHAARGWYVFPCKPRDKYPITPNGWHDATIDEAKIRAWWTKTPNANVGIACGMSGLAVLDIDYGIEGGAGWLAFKAWAEAAGIPDTYAVRTGRRPGFGVQLYFSGAVPDVHGWVIDGYKGDVKSLGGYVLAAGSVHPSGELYEALSDILQLHTTPDFVRSLRSPNAGTGKNAEPVVGGRHAHLTSVAGKMRHAGMSADAIEAGLLQHNLDNCKPPIPDADVSHIAKSVARYDVPERPPEVTIGSPAEPDVPVNWRSHYHTFDEMENAPPASFLIDGFLQLDAISALAAPVGQRKSLISLNVAHALCTGEPLFDYFKVAKRPQRVLYLCPEMGIISFADRVKRIGLMPFVGKTFFCRTMSKGGVLELAGLTVDELAGAAVIIDTAIRFLKGDESSSEHMQAFAKSIFRLMQDGASAVLLLHHSAKSTKEASELSLENAMRGSGELGAFVTSCWATRLQDPTEQYKSASFLVNVKQRDFESKPFEALCDSGCRMHMVNEPGDTVRLSSKSAGPTADKDGMEEPALRFIQDNPDLSLRESAKTLRDMGIKRSAEWVRLKRFEVLGKGTKTSTTP